MHEAESPSTNTLSGGLTRFERRPTAQHPPPPPSSPHQTHYTHTGFDICLMTPCCNDVHMRLPASIRASVSLSDHGIFQLICIWRHQAANGRHVTDASHPALPVPSGAQLRCISPNAASLWPDDWGRDTAPSDYYQGLQGLGAIGMERNVLHLFCI